MSTARKVLDWHQQDVAELARALRDLPAGRYVLVPETELTGEQELTPEQAADLLHVSCAYLLDLLDRGALPARKVGPHRRLRATDVLAYKARDNAERKAVMDELTAEAQRLGLYD
jgi:excisionase family DNA binding protein